MEWRKCMAVLFIGWATSAETIYVSPSGSDAGGNGGGDAPYATIMKAVGVAQSGDTILIRNGTYKEAIVIPASLSGTEAEPTVMRGESRDETVVDGEFQRGYLFTSKLAEYFYLENLTFRNARWPYWNRGAVQPKAEGYGTTDTRLRGWRIRDIVVEKSEGDGLSMCNTQGAVVQNCILQDNFQTGLTGSRSNALRVIGCTLQRNNAGWAYNPWKAYMEQNNYPNHVSLDPQDGKYYVSVGFGCGGAKFIPADSTIFENCTANGNSGPGVWWDGHGQNTVVRNCIFRDNFSHAHNQWGNYRAGGTGVMYENSPGPFLIEGCEFHNIDREDLNICESSNGIIRNNVVTGVVDGNGEGKGRFTFRDGWSVGGRSPICNVTVENNIFRNTYIECRRGGPDNWNADTLEARNIAFNNNQWQGTEPWIHEWENRPTKEIYGLDNMRAAWGMFLSDTYQTEITANREYISPVYRAVQTRIRPFARTVFVFDMTGRRISTHNYRSNDMPCVVNVLIGDDGVGRKCLTVKDY